MPLAARRAAPSAAPHKEPVSEFTVHIADGQLAFVRADAYLMRDGQRRSQNMLTGFLVTNVLASLTLRPAQSLRWRELLPLRGLAALPVTGMRDEQGGAKSQPEERP